MGQKSGRDSFQNYNNSFAFVTEKSMVHFFKTVYDFREFDLIEENLGKSEIVDFSMNNKELNIISGFISGSLISRFDVISNKYVPEQMIQKINTATSSVMENGLYRFYRSFANILGEIKTNKHDFVDVNLQALHLEQILFPFIYYFVSLMVAFIAFVIELTVFRYNVRRQQS